MVASGSPAPPGAGSTRRPDGWRQGLAEWLVLGSNIRLIEDLVAPED